MQHDLISISGLSSLEIESIWACAELVGASLHGVAAWSFEGNGIRTRTTFLQALRDLGLAGTELPNLLKSSERVEDIAGYLDPFYSLYVIRDTDHERLEAFARASSRPVINAMSAAGHPCEVLADAYYIDRHVCSLRSAHVCLWGPTTNVFRSWHELCAVLGLDVTQVCAEEFHEPHESVRFSVRPPARADIVITDAWPRTPCGAPAPLTLGDLVEMGEPALLPTPPFTLGKELLLDPRCYSGFLGYEQKMSLLPVQKAILRFAMGC